MAIFGPKPCVNPFGKMSVLRLLELLFFWPRKAVFRLQKRFIVLEYRKKHFPALYCFKKKVEKMAIFGQNHGLTPLKRVNSSTF